MLHRSILFRNKIIASGTEYFKKIPKKFLFLYSVPVKQNHSLSAVTESSNMNIFDDNNKKDTTNEKYDDGSVNEHRDSIDNGTKELTTAESNSSSNDNMTKLEGIFHNLQSSLSSNLLPIISQPEELLATLLNEETVSDDTNRSIVDQKQQKHQQQLLIQTTKLLFQYIENMSSIEEQLKELDKKQKSNTTNTTSEDEEEDNTIEDPCTLSGIPTIYTATNTEEVGVTIDAETIWGQVDLQNEALIPRIKKLIKKLTKLTTKENGKYKDDELVRILDMNGMNDEEGVGGEDSSDDEDDSDEEGGEMMSMGSAASDFGEVEGPSGKNNINSDEDSDSRRVRIRMEKAMADMDDDNSDDDDDGSATNLDNADDEERQQKLKQLTESAALLEEEEGVDQTREDMRDGFFDLHEMEAFADEEEEMLPDAAYGDIPDKKGNESDSEEEDDDEEDPLSKRYEPTTIRRKKYRADDEVDALCKVFDMFILCYVCLYTSLSTCSNNTIHSLIFSIFL